MSDDGSATDLTVSVGDIRLKNPVMLASGTCGYGDEIAEFVDLDEIGGIVVKGLSLHPEIGNPPPRIAETRAGMLNSIGLQNIGVEAFIRDKLPALRECKARIVANMWGRSIEEYAAVAARLDEAEGLDAVEVNISCPNIKEGGIAFGTDPELTRTVTAAVRGQTSLPVWVKLTPNVTDIGTIARAAEDGGAHALSVINTLRGMVVEVGRRRPVLSAIFGGLSGPAVFPVALFKLYEVSLTTSLPLIGIGGISDLDSALQFLIVGASAIQVGTANFYDPGLPQRLVDELASWCRDERVRSLRDIIGTLDTG